MLAVLESLINVVMSHQAMIIGILFGISEALSMIPQIKANGIFQAIYNFLKSKKA